MDYQFQRNSIRSSFLENLAKLAHKMDYTNKDQKWRELAMAFYALAHNNEKDFEKLSPELKNSEVGILCRKYIETNNHELIDEAGHLLTGTTQWYVYLGRTF